MGKKKKFIEKKKSATFQLLARDSSDPIYDTGPSSDRVFVRVDNNPYSINNFSDELHNDDVSIQDDANSIFADAPGDYDSLEEDQVYANQTQQLPDHIRQEILELGFPDDGYNYLAHLREIKNTGGGSAFYHNSKARLDQLPVDIKAYDVSRVQISEANGVKNDEMLYNVASKTVNVRIQKAIDNEVAALLDDGDLSRFGSDVEDLEEDFVIQANLPEEGEGVGLDENLNLNKESEGANKLFKESDTFGFQENEVRKHFVEAGDGCCSEKPRVRRLLDEQFDLLECQEYGSENDDAYDDFIAGEGDSLAIKLNQALKDHVIDGLEEPDDTYKAPTPDVIQKCVYYAKKYENETEDSNEDVVVFEESSDESEKWDCETIVSTYSNLDNHPGKIEAPGMTRKKMFAETCSEALNAPNHIISLRGKEKLPVDFLPHVRKAATETVKGVTSSNLEIEKPKSRQHEQESKEKKKERKAAVKEGRREARRIKKEMKGLYRCEAQRAQKVAAVSGPSSIHLL